MPMFFFDIVEIDGTYSEDIIGMDLADNAAAKLEAKRCLAELTQRGVGADLSEVRVGVRGCGGQPGDASHSLPRKTNTSAGTDTGPARSVVLVACVLANSSRVSEAGSEMILYRQRR